MKVLITVMLTLMLGLSCAPSDNACIRLVKENEQLTERNYKLSRAAFGSGDTNRLIYLKDPHYRASASRAITDNNRQIKANNKAIVEVCTETK